MKYKHYEQLLKNIEEGWIQVNTHPTLPLSIYNYTNKTSYEKHWDESCLDARGLILDNEGEVIAKPWPKFFNYEEIPTSLIPNESFDVFDKEDGSLGIGFFHKGSFNIATRGSFQSDQAIKAKEILGNKYKLLPSKTVTYLFEIIYPENRIVLDYKGEQKLVLLSIIDHQHDYEWDWDLVKEVSHEANLPLVKKYDGINDYKTLKQLVRDDQEGFIVKFKSGFRMKIKGDEYCRLHGFMTQLSTYDVWESLKQYKSIDPIIDRNDIPDEMYQWILEVYQELQLKYYIKEKWAQQTFERIKRPLIKDCAEAIKKEMRWMQPILFSLMRGKDYSEHIWKLCKPKFSRAFFNQ